MNFTRFIKSKAIWIICILSFLSALFYNELNLKEVPKEKTRAGETILTSDGASYLNPAISFHKKGIWREGSVGKVGYFLRPPGYGIFYLFFLKISTNPLTLKLLKLTQLLLFSLSVYWFYFIAISILRNKKLALLTSLIYGVSPFFIGFLYYTLTEGITPALLILFIFLLFKAYQKENIKQKHLYYFLATFTFAYLILVRPQIGLFGLFIPLFNMVDFWRISIKKAILVSIIFSSLALSFFATWEYRNYKIAGEFVGLHPMYFEKDNNMFRPTLSAFWDFNKCWGLEGHIYHSYSLPFWQNTIKGDSSKKYIDTIIKHYPKKVTTYFGKDRLSKVLKNYQHSILLQKPFYEKRVPLPANFIKHEQTVVNQFNQLTAEYKKEFWFDYHIVSPLRVFKTMAFHSNLSLYIFQKTYRGTWWMETIRYLFFVLHSLCFLALIYNLFYLKKENFLFYGINFTLFIYVFYLCYFQRGIEERYTLPILPLLLIGLVFSFLSIKEKLLKFSK